jgi:hypothetical protein
VQEVPSEVEQPERYHYGGSRDWSTVGSDIAIAWNDGRLHNINPSTAINAFLPPPGQQGSGPEVFVIHVPSGAAANLQIRDDAGNTVGTAFGATTGGIRTLHLLRTTSGTTWISS